MTSTLPRYYEHPDPDMRDVQDIRRGYAALAVRAGRIRWSASIGVSGGFVEVITKGKRRGLQQRIDLTGAIALHELRQAGRITVDKTTGEVLPVDPS